MNVNKVIDIDSKDGINLVDLTPGNGNYDTYVSKGGQYGDIYVQTLQKDAQGRLMLNPRWQRQLFPGAGQWPAERLYGCGQSLPRNSSWVGTTALRTRIST
jgi:hypothetical protein